ncbi:Glycosyltransferase involved in cell wall bisynthesis [Hydrobacter penzbergensis]|uniref:Glycosyltransferase involved in cell wall bisynthesis n=1 Tax=Hydrobacter penzbergensis TaxID=1235997 RepID=A0A8X8IGX3_9BACT|nr:glycosyltransferase family 4 protein [Hydrobacter penzbergensis]SDW85280.1 Glycosyltransferase involved in cell wall bisynthesis [Hydrobacter penzbergensis]
MLKERFGVNKNCKNERDVWIISELFYPETISTGYIMTEIAEWLSKSAKISVIAGPNSYDPKAILGKGTSDLQYEVYRITNVAYDKNKSISRLLGQLLLSFRMLRLMLKIIPNGARLLMVTNPILLLWFTSFFSKKRRWDITLIVHDVFPDNAAAGGFVKKGSIFFKILQKIFSRSYQLANKLIVIGSDMEDLIKKKVNNKTSIEVITNWADPEIIPLEIKNYNEYYPFEVNGKLIIQFAGNIGRLQGLDHFFNALQETKKRNFVVVLIGEGALKPILEKFKASESIDNVHFLNPKSRSEQCQFLNNCDIGLVTLSPGMYGLGVPSKVYNILSVGKPILYIGDKNTEIAKYIEYYKVGWAFTWEDKISLINFLENIATIEPNEIIVKGRNARALAESRFTKEKILEEYKEVIFN